MDDIFEQMLSTSPWGDGVGMNRAAWDAVAGSSANNMGIDPARELQGLPKVPPMPVNPLMGGGLGNHGLNRALQDSNGRLPDGMFDAHGVHASHHLQPWNQPYLGGIPPTPSALSRGKSDTYLLQEGSRREVRLGKRVREEDDMLLDGHPENMVHVSQNAGLQPGQGYGDPGALNEDPAGTSSSGAAKPRVRARRGQATDPHSIAERNRRERIAERMRALQELVPDSNKTDKASMLDEIIGYVKFLQMQVKCLSMCRLGGAGAAAVPLLADLPVEGASNFLAAANLAQAHGGLGSSQEGMALAERQVAQLMDEDMSAAMQYLQSKGLCLMPISLATAISSTGVRQQATPTKPPTNSAGNGKQASEAAATVVAAALTGGGGASAGKDNMGTTGGLVPKTAKDMQKDDHAE